MLTKNYLIVVAVDGSEVSMRTVDYAVELAKHEENSLLILLNILNIDMAKQSASSFIAAPTYGLEEYEQHKKEALKWLDEIKMSCEKRGVITELEILGGPLPIASSIVSYCENRGVDLIVVGTRGKSGFKKLLLGSVASGIVTYAHCPVLVVK
jgi:nucleotide-binding universal stress UspA family protein